MDPTIDPAIRSFVPVPPGSDFPLQNLPYGVFRPVAGGSGRCGVAIGEHVVDLAVLEAAGLLAVSGAEGTVFDRPSLNAFMALGRPAWKEVRARLHRLLRDDEPTLKEAAAVRDEAILRRSEVTMLLPAEIGDYTDFYSSREHATNVGTMFRGKDNALMPNWLHLPVAYHGRASSVIPSGIDVRRPRGQTKADDADLPSFGPSRLVDFELEMGFFVGPGTSLGEPVPVSRSEEHIFGLALVNDWSARDIQKWEYVPLGPFLAKNFATTVSPWVVTLEALEPFRVDGREQDPTPLPYLGSSARGSFDIGLEVGIRPDGSSEPHRVCRSNFRYLYWTMSQQLAHHTVTGCNLRPGDLMASGTISGPDPESFGSMLEIAWRGTKPVTLSDGSTRAFIQDGDEVVMTGAAERDGVRIGFGECRARLLPAEKS
jgi:fumarylacetoacetase